MSNKEKAKRRKIRKMVKRTFRVLTVAMVLALSIIILKAGATAVVDMFTPEEGYDKMLTYGDHRIKYYSVNVRSEPNENSEIIDTLTLGDYVHFTGNTYKSAIYERYPFWVELENGGWIISESKVTDDDFYFLFGH